MFYSLLFFALILASCNSSELSISEIQNVPNKVQDEINSNYTLQLIFDGENKAYIIFHTKGTVTADLETKNNTLIVKLDNTDKDNNELKQFVYKLTWGATGHDTIEVLVNGQSTPFDNVTGLKGIPFYYKNDKR